jgi:hypothetical protein
VPLGVRLLVARRASAQRPLSGLSSAHKEQRRRSAPLKQLASVVCWIKIDRAPQELVLRRGEQALSAPQATGVSVLLDIEAIERPKSSSLRRGEHALSAPQQLASAFC